MKSIFIIAVTISVVAGAKQVCEPRSQYNDYCNICTCSDDGLSAVCTRMTCDKELWNPDGTLKTAIKNPTYKKLDGMVCTPNSLFKNICNTCGCSSDGMSFICTKMICDMNIWNEDGSLKIIPQLNRKTRSII